MNKCQEMSEVCGYGRQRYERYAKAKIIKYFHFPLKKNKKKFTVTLYSYICIYLWQNCCLALCRYNKMYGNGIL